jgi:serine/threonine protein kinase/tetratricopeptide (TPR) repeat protein
MAAQGNAKERLFNAAAELTDPGQRAAFLDATCGHDPSLRAEIEDLLRHDDAAAGFLSAPALSPDATPGARATEPPPQEPLISRIGPYKLLQVIGEGGMGTVWMAEQTEPVKRLVAVKLIKAGMDSKQVIARFEAERQALALMDHPNIARVLDAGATRERRPYFAMELVKGIPITRYCDERRMSVRERLELFVPVCQAVQHAHQKGVIHRDLKPSNVLVAPYDGIPVVKVIDFGVAKAAGQPLTERTLATGFGAVVGTLEYMSPEQAELNNLDIDTRSDIYSLGVLLYELLTGTTPLPKKRLNEADFAEVIRIIREEEPPRPSTRLSTTEELPSIAANRGEDPSRLSGLVRGELDWIVMKALEKDRSRRYETASGLSHDLLRYLSDEPVRACPPSSWYRFRKFVRRNKRSVLAASLISLALVAGVIGTTWGLIRAEGHRLVVVRQRNELDQRNQALQSAHEHARLLNERARQAIEAVTSETAIELLTREKELRPEQKEFLDKMIQYFAESTQEVAATEKERFRQAQAYYRMGRLNQILGRSQDSENAYRRAVALGRELAAAFPSRTEYRQELARSHNNLGVLLQTTGQLKEAEAAYDEVLAIYAQLVADFPSRPEFRQGLAGIHNNLGQLLNLEGERLKEAEAAHAEALAIRKQLVADFPDRPVFRRALAMSHNNLGWLFQTTNRLEKAEAAFRDAVAVQKLAAADVPNRPEFRLELAKYQFNLGNLLRESERLKEAEAVYGESLPIQKQLVADFPNRPDFRQDLSGGLNSLGQLLRDTGQSKEAEAAYTEALAIQKQLAADFPRVSDYRNELAGTLFNLANAAGNRQDFAASRRWLDEAFPYHRGVLQANPRNAEYRSGYRNSLMELAKSCSGLGDRPAALAAATKRRDLGWEPATDAYEAACMLARCVPIVEKSNKLDAASRQAEMRSYADQAMAMLRDAVAKGYKNIEYLKGDMELNALREREDFKTLLVGLQNEKR